MRLRTNVIFQYSLTTFGIVAVISALLGLTMAGAITNYQLRSHIRLYPEIVRLTMNDPGELIATLGAGGPVSPEEERLLRGFFSLGIFRVKVWNPSATIVWSDQKDLIGQRFDDDDAFHVAMGGTVTYELGEAEKAENIDERDRGITLQIYTPIMDGGRVAGVVELYEANRDLFAQIARNTRFISLIVVAAGIAIYISLFLVFYRSQKAQEKTQAQVVETQNVTIYALAYQAELRD